MKRPGGLTLIEIVVAVGVITILAAAIFTGVSSNLRLSQDSRNKARADQCTQSVVERYRAYWSSSPDGGTTPYYNTDPPSDPTSTLNRPVISDLCQGLDAASGYGLTIDDSRSFDAAGTDITATRTPGAPPAARGLTVTVTKDGRTLSRIVTRIAQPPK